MKFIKYAAVSAALVAGGIAHADTRASGAITAKKSETAQRGNPQGPKNGFKDNHGRERSWEVADEHARFHRNDSEG